MRPKNDAIKVSAIAPAKFWSGLAPYHSEQAKADCAYSRSVRTAAAYNIAARTRICPR